MAADLATTLPPQVEINAHRRLEYVTETVVTDGGFEVRNNRWADPLRTYEVSFPHARRDNAVYTAVVALFHEAKGSLYSFTFHDYIDDEDVVVRFDSALEIDTPTPDLDHIVSVVLKEVKQ